MTSYKNYRIEWVKSASKAFNSLQKGDASKILEKINLLLCNEEKLDIKKLKGYREFYRIRSGDYRIVFEVDKSKQIIHIVAVAHRGHVYELIKKLSLLLGLTSLFEIH